MTGLPVGVVGGATTLLADGEYPRVLVDRLRRAQRRCLASLFIVDAAGASEWLPALFAAVEEARWRGADVRVLLGGSRINLDIAERAAGASRILRDLGIPCRWLTARPTRGSHVKLVVVDDAVFVGSHNWSAGAFSDQHQDSLLVDSADLAAYLCGYFNDQWRRAGEAG